MKVVVLLKAILDLSQVRYSKSQRKLEEKGARLLAPVSENVLEVVRQMKEKVSDVVAVGILLGRAEDEPVLRKAIAFGLDQAVMITGNVDSLDHAAKAKIIKAAIDKLGKVDVLLSGGATKEGGGGQIGVRVAEALGFGGVQAIEDIFKSGPDCFLQVEFGSNQPKIPNMMAVMKASTKEITAWKIEDVLEASACKPVVEILREEWLG